MSESTTNYSLYPTRLILPKATTMTLNLNPTKTIPNTNTKTAQGAFSVKTMDEAPGLHHRQVEAAGGGGGIMGSADRCPKGSRTQNIMTVVEEIQLLKTLILLTRL